MSKPVYIKKNGIMNKISSMSIGVNTPFIYSEDEREVGVWTDGKPLYQKTFYIETLPYLSSTLAIADLSEMNVDKVVLFQGFCTSKVSDGYQRPIPLPDGNNDIRADVTGYMLQIKVLADWSSYEGYLTIQYTKTTDTPGSGKWSNNGGPAHHYSTSEQVVGTWIDGKTIYERTYEVALPLVTVEGSESTVDVSIGANVDYYIKTEAIAKNNYGVVIRTPGINLTSGQWSFFRMSEYTNDATSEELKNKIRLRVGLLSLSECAAKVTVQYTKTTN